MVKVNLLRSRLALLGMSQADLADRIGMSKNTMSSRMTGKSSFNLEEVAAICEVLGIIKNEEKREIFLA